ncbi:MAG: hypothetical protein ACOZAM_14955 [Pseudomonadota bacterium]
MATIAKMATWVSPTAMDGNRGNEPPRPWDTEVPLSQQVVIASPWRTPNTLDAKGGTRTGEGQVQLCHQAKHALWATIRATDGEKGGPNMKFGAGGQPLPAMAAASNGSSEPTEKRGALNPEFVCWLMGYPQEWVNCAPSAMPSTRGPRRRSLTAAFPDLARAA